MAVMKRKDRGTWEFRLDLGQGPDGKRRQVRQGGFKTRAAARDAEIEYLKDQDDDLEPRYEKDSVAEYLERWLKTYAEPRVEPTTLKRYRELVRIHLIPHIGTINLRKLKPLDIEACYQAILAVRSTRTAEQAHRVLSGALKQGVKWRVLSRNPADAVEAPRPKRAEVRVPTRQELDQLLAAGDATAFGVIYRLAVLTGLRQGELCALKWEFVDLDAATLSVRASAGRLKGRGIVVRQTKTEKSRRTIALPAVAVELLRAHRERQRADMEAEPSDYQRRDFVFADALGRPLDGVWVGKVWARLADTVGRPEGSKAPGPLAHVRFHDLRHTNASLLLQAGVPLKVVQEHLGHTTISTTADIYTHIAPEIERSAAEKLDLLWEKE